MDRASSRDAQGRDTVATIGTGVVITGEVNCDADLQIDGRIKGEVRCGTLFLGETGSVEGLVQADRVRVSGLVDGTIVAGDLAIEAGGKVKGEIIYARLKVTAGAVIEGRLEHRAGDVAAAAAEPASLKLVEPGETAPVQPRRVYID